MNPFKAARLGHTCVTTAHAMTDAFTNATNTASPEKYAEYLTQAQDALNELTAWITLYQNMIHEEQGGTR